MKLQSFKTSVLKFINDEDGLTMVEYAIAGSLVAAATVLAFITLGTNVKTVITTLGCAVQGKTC